MENSKHQIILDELYANFLSKLEKNLHNYIEKDIKELHLKYSNQVKEEWKIFYDDLTSHCTQLKEEKANIEKEKTIIEQITKNEKDEILSLNISGKEIIVKKSILTQIKGSRLEILIKNDEKLLKDKNNSIYFDFDYDCFKIIIEYLKLKSLETNNKKAPLPVIPENLTTNFIFLIDYLGLSQIFEFQNLQLGEIDKNPKVFEQFDINYSYGNIKLSENDTICTLETQNHSFILGKNIYSKGRHVFQFEVLKLLNNLWMFIGIIDDSLKNYLNNTSFQMKGSYGWAGCGNQVFADGKHYNYKDTYNSKEDFRENDKISLTLNLEDNILKFTNLRNKKQYKINIPPNCEWRIHINLYYLHDCIKLIN